MKKIFTGSMLIILALVAVSCETATWASPKRAAQTASPMTMNRAVTNPGEGDQAVSPNQFLPLIVVPDPTVTPTPTPIDNWHTFPPYSTSLYITTVDGATLYRWGCEIGMKDLNTPGAQDSLVILAYGYPKFVNGYYGASLMGYGPVSVDQIAFATMQFAWGYYVCTGTDFDSHLRIGIGTNNYPGQLDPSVNFAHGAAWGRMVNQVAAWIIDHGAGRQVDIVGASDIELSWNSYAASKDWLDGYDAVNLYDLVNFGAIPGCPSFSRPGAQCGTYPYLWSREQVWYVIYGAGPVYPLPEIYLTNGVNAEQWYLMSVYSVEYHGKSIDFIGSLTTYQACQQRGGCSGPGWAINNTPQQGWTQLYTLLNSNPLTAQGLRWASDMRWTSPPRPLSLAEIPDSEPVLSEGVAPASQSNQESIEALRASLQLPDLSDAMRQSLQNKLMAAERMESLRQRGAQNPAAKVEPGVAAAATPEPPRPLEGGEQILEGSEGLVQPMIAEIRNMWRGSIDGSSRQMQVLAGAQAEQPDQGILILLVSQPDQGSLEGESYLAPAGSGSLRIIERQGADLLLEGSSGVRLVFNLVDRTFRQPG